MLHRMDSVIIHIRLLFIQPDDGKIQTDILTCHGVSITHELFQIAKISFYVAKLSAECAADFLCRALPALSKCKILFSGTFAISSWQLKTIALTKTVNHGLQFFSCFIQKWDILRITYVCRRTGCIKGWLKSRKECCKVSKIKCLQLNWINSIWNTWQK